VTRGPGSVVERLLSRWRGRAPRRRYPVAERLDPRILYAAETMPLDSFTPERLAADVRLVDTNMPSVDMLQTTTTMIFIDRSLEDAERLAGELLTQAPAAQLIWLDDARSLIDQVSDALAGHQNVEAIHILTHGRDGQLILGDTVTDLAALEANASRIHDWQNALTQDADILLYGCDVAGGPIGAQFLTRLAALSSADLGASDDITGQGGDWTLEHRIGVLDSQVLQASAWQGRLGLTVTGSNIEVNTTVSNRQTQADITMFDDGGWAVAWDDKRTGGAVFRVFDASGSALSAEIILNVNTGATATTPAIATNGVDRIAVAFVSDINGSADVMVSIFDRDGNPVQTDILVNSGYLGGDQVTPSIAMDRDGGFVVAWAGAGSGDDTGIYTRTFASDGTATSAIVPVNLGTTGIQSEPDIALAADGSYVVTWVDEYAQAVRARVFNPTGGSEILVNADLLGSVAAPSVAIDGAGNFTVVWQETTLLSDGSSVQAARFDASGGAIGSTLQVNVTDSGDQSSPTIAMNRDGGFVVAWTDASLDGSGTGIVTRAFLNGAAVTGEVLVNADPTDDQLNPSVAMNNSGQVVVVWEGARTGGNQSDLTARLLAWPEGVVANAAPVLDAAMSPTLAPVAEDAPAPTGAVGTLVSDLVNPGNVSDADPGALAGIALTDVDTALGSWYFSLDQGTNWTLIDGAGLNDANALLLAADGKTRLYLSPAANLNGTTSNAVTFRAWDRTSGQNGGFADTSTNGGTTAFSTAVDTASLTITAVNDAPTITLNQLSITEGTSVLIDTSALAIDDIDSTLANVRFDASGVSQGYFYRSAAPTVAITSFTWAEVTGGQIYFLHDGSENAPAYTLIATDAEGAASAPSSATISFSPVNDQPTLAPASLVISARIGDGPPVGTVGQRITTLVTLAGSGDGPQNVTDPDTGASAGIAIVSADESEGLWYFTVDGGSSWQSLTAGVPPGEARLLQANDATRLYFQVTGVTPTTLADAIVFHAWDASTGTNGGTAVVDNAAATSAFSQASDGIELQIISTNTTPTLDTVPDRVVDTVEDAAAPTGSVGVRISALASLAGSGSGAQNITDPDSGALSGLAIVGMDTTGGDWWYSLDDGAQWSRLTASVSNTNALLLANDNQTRIYFQPTVANFNGTLSDVLQFKAWDQTWGTNGSFANSLLSTAFSSTIEQVAVNVMAVDDAPTVTVNPVSIAEGGVTVIDASVLAALDVDTPSSALTYTVTAGSAAHFALGANPALALTQFTDAQVRNGEIVLVHDGSETTPSVTLTLEDGQTTIQVPTLSITLVPVNDAPVLTPTGTAGIAVDEDAGIPTGAVGAPVTAIVSLSGSASGPENISDPDASGLSGIAITRTDTSAGTWYFTRDNGVTWTAISPVSENSALLLDALDTVRIGFAPAPDVATSIPAALQFRAWDQSTGSAGSYADTTSSSAYSAASDTFSLTIRPVDDAPVLIKNTLDLSEGEQVTLSAANLSASDVDTASTALTYQVTSVSGGRFALIGATTQNLASFTQAQVDAGQIVFIHDGGEAAPGITLSLSDGTTTLTDLVTSINFTPVDDAPGIGVLEDQSVLSGEGFGPLSFTVIDADTPPDRLTVSVVSSDPKVVPDDAIVLTHTGTQWQLSVQDGHAGTVGVSVLTVSVSDGTSTRTRQLRVTAEMPQPIDEPAVVTVSTPERDTIDTVEETATTGTPPESATPTAASTAAEIVSEAPPALFAETAGVVVITPTPASRTETDTSAAAPTEARTPPTSTGFGLPALDLLTLMSPAQAETTTSTLAGSSGDDALATALDGSFDQLHDAARGEELLAQTRIGATVVTGAGLTIGYVAWLIRGGVLVTSLLSTMPAWRLLDPLPILGGGDGDAPGGDDESLESMVTGPAPAPGPDTQPASGNEDNS